MIGCIHGQSDVYAFCEERDIDQLSRGQILGDFVSLERQLLINNGILIKMGENGSYKTKASLIKDNELEDVEGLEIVVEPKTFTKFKNDGIIEDHQGFCHVNLINSVKCRWHDMGIYIQLVSYRQS